jgi:hypothetical protein
MIKAWSMSRLDVYESCPYRAYLQYVLRIPQNDLVIPPGKSEHPLTRGLRVHTAAEEFVTKDINLIDELQSFSSAFDLQRTKYRESPELCCIEQDWAITSDWTPTGWFSEDAWGRMKLDYGEVQGDTMLIVDYKTGKKYPPKHVQQGQLYALVSGLRYPDIKKFKVEFWYTDSGDMLEQSYSKLQTLMFKEMFDLRARTMTTATEFKPHPSGYACRFCPYGEGRDGNKHCDYRYSFDN